MFCAARCLAACGGFFTGWESFGILKEEGVSSRVGGTYATIDFAMGN